MLLSTAFFPPVSWFAAAASSQDGVYLEACENFCKQSYRNRCHIAAAGGTEAISVPIVHEGDLFHTLITEVMIDYQDPWVKKARRAIESAYRTSPFFEYYKDDIFSILDSGIPRLWDLNLALIRHFIKKTNLGIEPLFTEEFTKPSAQKEISAPGPYGLDYRAAIHPKRPNSILAGLNLEKPYFQVFAQKYGFIKDLSVMDLLFNEGPESLLWLRTSIRRS